MAGGNITLAGGKIILAGLVTIRQSHPVRAREFLNNGILGVYSPELVTPRLFSKAMPAEGRLWPSDDNGGGGSTVDDTKLQSYDDDDYDENLRWIGG